VSFENAFARSSEGLEEDTVLHRVRGAKRVFIGVFVLLGSPLVLAACCGTWRVPLKGVLADLGPHGEQAWGGGVGLCISPRQAHFIARPDGRENWWRGWEGPAIKAVVRAGRM
jgi:hypothetical protein